MGWQLVYQGDRKEEGFKPLTRWHRTSHPALKVNGNRLWDVGVYAKGGCDE